MYTEIPRENMILNIVSNLVAFLLGAIVVIVHTFNGYSTLSTWSIFTNPDNHIFLLKSIISGVVALMVKVGGDLLIHKFKSKRNKNRNE